MLDESKICFIIIAAEFFDFNESIEYINKQKGLEQFEIVYYVVENVGNKYIEFNKILKECNAKYKVYIKTNCFITDPLFVKNAIDIMSTNKELVKLGIAGEKYNKEEDKIEKIGEYYVDDFVEGIHKVDYGKVEDAFLYVDQLEAYLYITSVDIKWGENFADETEIVSNRELQQEGYQLGVINQKPECCIIEKYK